MIITDAEIFDAPMIGEAVVAALGDELPLRLAGRKSVDDVINLFSTLAARDDSQYSYRNALKAVDSEGRTMGFIVGYDGAMLHSLRRAFFEEAKEILELDLEGEMGDECGPEEFYLDSLAVLPEFRGKGVAKALIKAMAKRGASCGKPLGLLCDKNNSRARRLYDSIGFRCVGERPFADEIMDHLMMI